jgi:predicted metal-binding protein
MKDPLKTYTSPWAGEIILACRKCQKKLKGNDAMYPLAKLAKTVKRQNKRNPERTLEIVNVSCMNLCPKDGVAVCDPCNPTRLAILRHAEDIERLRQ